MPIDSSSFRSRSLHRSLRDVLFPSRAAFLLLAILISILGVTQAAHAQTSADSTVTLLWTASGDDGDVGIATSYDLRYRTVGITGTDTLSWWNAATQITGEPVPRTAGSLDSMRVRGLQPLTTYYFMIRVSDEVPNVSGFSNLAVRTTSGDLTPPRTISDLIVTAATGTTLALRWTAPGDDGGTGTAVSYDIRYSTSTITAANWASATQATGEPAPAVAGTLQTFTLTGLTPSRTYYIAIKSTDDGANVSLVSNIATGVTPDTVPPAPVRDLSMNLERLPAEAVVDRRVTKG